MNSSRAARLATALLAVAMLVGAGHARSPSPSPSPRPAVSPKASPSPKPGPSLPTVPSWVQPGRIRDRFFKQHEANLVELDKVNKAKTKLDLVLFGDSLTAYHAYDPSGWNKYFGKYKALALGMNSSYVSTLAWRMVAGGEELGVDPRVIVLWVGINNLYAPDGPPKQPRPEVHLQWLVKWTMARYPTSQLIIQSILPTTKIFGTPTVVRNYKALAGQYKLPYMECGGDLGDWAFRKDLWGDKLHPTQMGHDLILRCQSKFLAKYLNSQTASPSLASLTLHIPSWVEYRKFRWSHQRQYEANLAAVASLNKTKTTLDLALYGDSLAAYYAYDPGLWRAFFKGYKAEPLEVNGSYVSTLAWRMVAGGEMLARCPRVIVLWVGINNLFKQGQPAPGPHLQWLTRLVLQTCPPPQSQPIIQGILPTAREKGVAEANQQCRQIAKQYRLPYIECGGDLGDPLRRRDMWADRVHPTRKGHERILSCLSRGLRPYLPPAVKT